MTSPANTTNSLEEFDALDEDQDETVLLIIILAGSSR